METRSIQLPFCGFYESAASRMIDDEIEQAFACDDSGMDHNIPDAVYYKAAYCIDYKAIQIELVKAYVDAYSEQYKDETGIDLQPVLEEMTSPREYNFETDRVFCSVPYKVVLQLFEESENHGHNELTDLIKDRCTSYDGFISFYSNRVSDWLLKPIGAWDHNELQILLEAVLNIHYTPSRHGDGHFDIYDLLDGWRGNGELSNAVWGAMPKLVQDFANEQREYQAAVDFDLWIETGKCYADGTDRNQLAEAGELPFPRCDRTLDLPLEGGAK